MDQRPPHLSDVRRRCAVAAVAIVAVFVGCAAESASLDPLPLADDCRCQLAAGGACPIDVCDVEIVVEAATCQGEVQLVEVMLGAALEPQILRPGVPLRSCTTIPRGGSVQLEARGDTSWLWRETLACPAVAAGETVGPTIERTLHCTAGR